MTYAGYLAVFLGGPLLVLAVLAWRAAFRYPQPWRRLAWIALAAHVVVAVVYTTPWDNYLVATGVWWYDPARVAGLTLWWVPLEEYCFFVLQTLMTGLWLIWLLSRSNLPSPLRGEGWGEGRPLADLRWRPWAPGLTVAGLLALIWSAALGILLTRWAPGAYLALEVAWFLPPIIVQVIVGAAMLWEERRLLLMALVPPIIYLSITDALAIAAGVWTISPQKTLGFHVARSLPIEELIFFTLTNTLVVFGILLVLVIGSSVHRTHDRQPSATRSPHQ